MQHARGTLQESVKEFKQALLDDSDDESEESSPDTDDWWDSSSTGDPQPLRSATSSSLTSAAEETKDDVDWLNRFLEKENVQNESRISGLESSLIQAKQQVAETEQKVAKVQEKNNELMAQCEESKREAEEARTRAATKEQQNEELSSDMKRLLDQRHTETEESEFALDRRSIEAKVKDYFKLLSAQGVVDVFGQSKEEMVYVVCEAAGLPFDIYQVCLGGSAAAEARVNRTRAAGIMPINPNDSNPQGAQREQPPAAAGEQQPAAPTQFSSIFLEYLESEAAQ